MDRKTEERFIKAAIEGVVERIDSRQIDIVVSFMKVCHVADAVIVSTEVQKAAEEYIEKSLHMFSFADEVINAILLMKTIKMPKKRMDKIILGYLESYTSKWKQFPEYIYLFIDSCDLPPEKINTKKYAKFAENQITLFTANDESTLFRIRCFLKHFSLSREAIMKVANQVLVYFIHDKKNRDLTDEIIEMLKLNREELLCAIKKAQKYLLRNGNINKVIGLSNRFGISKSEFLNDLDRCVAAEGFLNNLPGVEFEINLQQYVDRDIFLVSCDFDEDAVEFKIEEYLECGELDEAEKLAKFIGVPHTKMSELVRENLGRFLFFGKERVRVVAEAYGIGWGEVICEVEKELIRNLAGRGVENAKYLIEAYCLPAEFLQSKEVIDAATKGLIKLYEVADCNNLAWYIHKTFNI